jgi:hypothetical protein
MSLTFSVVLNHAPWAHDRDETVRTMLRDLGGPEAFLLNATDYRGGGPSPKSEPVRFTLDQWEWAARQDVAHHVFMTDDLELYTDLMLGSSFLLALSHLLEFVPGKIVGLLSNHPRCRELYDRGHRWYRTNSWVVGPCYVVPHHLMVRVADWAARRWPHETVDRLGWSDDAELNEWISKEGPREAWHPLPTIIRHRRDPSTWSHTGHGDEFSHERLSVWDEPGPYNWSCTKDVPLLPVGGP